METMPYRPDERASHKVFPHTDEYAVLADNTTTTTDWRAGLPVLVGAQVSLRELRLSDAPSLLALLTTEEVARFISPPPTTLAGFERFIQWTYAQAQAGAYACFAIVPFGMETAIGIIQVRALETSFEKAEWGFAIGSPYWGRGHFSDAASLVLAFAFETLGVHRLEARASVENGRGNGALRKVGAVREARLRHSFRKDGRAHDQYLWTMLATEWRQRTACLSASLVMSADHTAAQPSRVH